MQVAVAENWQTTDKYLYLVHNFSDVRAAINVTVDGVKWENDTIPAATADY